MWLSGLSPHTYYSGLLANKGGQKLVGSSAMHRCATLALPNSAFFDTPQSFYEYGSPIRSSKQCPGARKRENRALVAMATAKEMHVESSDTDTEAFLDPKVARRAEDWERAMNLKESGGLYTVKVEACNNGGLVVRFGSLSGFLPFSQIGASRSPKDGKTMVDLGRELIGENVIVKVIEVNIEDKRLILSEKHAVWSQSVESVKEGDVFQGKVNCVTDFGAFIDLRFPNGSYPITGLVHISELSWDRVYDPRDIVLEGEEVRVKVTSVDIERMRLGLSIKQLQGDPLLETLDTLMPQKQEGLLDSVAPDGGESENASEPLPGLADICQELLLEEGINEVLPGRVALEKRVVSQDLELWICNAPVEEGSFKLLARAGRQVQEVDVKTSLDREGMKAAIQRVTGRVP